MRCLASPGTCLVRCGRRHEAWSNRNIYWHRLASTHWKKCRNCRKCQCKACQWSHKGKAPLSQHLSNVIRSCVFVCLWYQQLQSFGNPCFVVEIDQKSEMTCQENLRACKDLNSSRLPFPLALQHCLRAPLATYCCTSALHCSTTSGVIAS